MAKRPKDSNTQGKGQQANPVTSVIAALFGVQSERNRRQDFSQQSPWPFIVAGVAGIAVFVGVLVAITLVVTASR